MNIAKFLFRSSLLAATIFIVSGIYPALSQQSDSDFCVVGSTRKDLYAPAVKSYYRHNKIVMAGYKDVLNSYKHAKMRKMPNADAMIRRLEEAKSASPQLDRKMWGVVIEPPAFADLSRSCERLSTTNIPFVEAEYPIVLNSDTPRLIGAMCAEEPAIRFDVTRSKLNGVNIELADFYDPAYSADRPFGYAELEQQADRNRKLPAFIRALMGVRMAQCGDLPASMTLVAESEDEPVMTASLLYLDDGIQIMTRDDATAQRIVAARKRAQEQLAARLNRSTNWEESAAVGAATLITGLAIMLMNRCNDHGNFGNTSLPDCE